MLIFHYRRSAKDKRRFETKEMGESNTDKIYATNESVWLCVLKSTLNLLSHILISFVVLICLWFSGQSRKLSVVELHIVLCVLGYQFFMSQGILVLSKFNSWSKYIKYRHRRCLHWFLEFVGAMLIMVGSIEIIQSKQVHFNSLHGALGLCALITTTISILNGLMTSFAPKFTSHRVHLTSKCVHGVTGIATLFLSVASLHYGYDKGSFKRWIGNENFILALKVFTWLFTIFVGFEFWTALGKRMKYINIGGNSN